MDTFGPVDWREYYSHKERPEPEPPLTSVSPCAQCVRSKTCAKPCDPDASGHCKQWVAWFRAIWRAITGKKEVWTYDVHCGGKTNEKN